METIFDIFGSGDSIKRSTLNVPSQAVTTAKEISTEVVLPGKLINRSGETNLKGKKVLGDVRNKILGVSKKSECTSQDIIKKTVLGSSCASKTSTTQATSTQAHENSEKTVHKENSKTQSPMTLEQSLFSKDSNEWPRVETQGSLFWANDDYDRILSSEETPSIEDMYQTANIWDMEIKPSIRLSLSPSSDDLHDNFEFCLNLPASQSSEVVILKEETVEFPWEM